MKNKIFLSGVIIIAVLLISGCSISFQGKGGGGNDGGVFVSGSQGNTWQQRVLIPTTSGRPSSIATMDNYSLSIDPSDNKALYFGSIENGLYYTYNQGLEWRFVEGLGRSTIRDVKVDPKSKCTIYASIMNKVYKTVDCSRTWSEVYYDTDPAIVVNSIMIDHYNSDNVYIGTSRGEVIKSSDRGATWKTQGRFGNLITEIIMSPFDSRILFVATRDKGVFRSFDGGENWKNLEENLKDFPNSSKIRDFEFSPSEPGLIFLATNYGLLKTTNHGDTWSSISLITPEKEAIINAIAIGPKDPKEIYYVTNTTFYRSIDGGENWSTKKLPSTRAGRVLLIDPTNPNIIYLTTLQVKK